MRACLLISIFGLLVTSLQNDEEEKVLRTIRTFVEAVSTGDPVLMGSVLDKNGTSRYWDAEAQEAGEFGHEEYLQKMNSVSSEREKLLEVHVRVVGLEAAVWAKYNFYRNDTLSHCGSEVFSMRKKNGSWWIESVDYTIERKNCKDSD